MQFGRGGISPCHQKWINNCLVLMGVFLTLIGLLRYFDKQTMKTSSESVPLLFDLINPSKTDNVLVNDIKVTVTCSLTVILSLTHSEGLMHSWKVHSFHYVKSNMLFYLSQPKWEIYCTAFLGELVIMSDGMDAWTILTCTIISSVSECSNQYWKLD